ncbi:MAG: VOC family protein [Leptospirales bacterium]|nr:VOC family protein [Leptospirales bacterium]
METITPHLWFDKEAIEAARFYTSVFPRSRVKRVSKITGTPSGDCDIVSFELRGQPFEAISAGPYFKFNPSISFIVNFDPSKEQKAEQSINSIWEKLLPGGTVLMPLQEYPFSKRYGWIQDRFGLSWQLILSNPEGEDRPDIMPSLLFVGESCGRAEEAVTFYTSVFKNSKRGSFMRYDSSQPPEREGTVMFTDFRLQNLWLAAMDSARDHKFGFNESISLMVNCDTQREIDYYWQKLSAVPQAEQCGWLKDKFGLSWQIVPRAMQEMMAKADKVQLDRITKAFLKMKKFDIKELERAANAKSVGKKQVAKSKAIAKPGGTLKRKVVAKKTVSKRTSAKKSAHRVKPKKRTSARGPSTRKARGKSHSVR